MAATCRSSSADKETCRRTVSQQFVASCVSAFHLPWGWFNAFVKKSRWMATIQLNSACTFKDVYLSVNSFIPLCSIGEGIHHKMDAFSKPLMDDVVHLLINDKNGQHPPSHKNWWPCNYCRTAWSSDATPSWNSRHQSSWWIDLVCWSWVNLYSYKFFHIHEIDCSLLLLAMVQHLVWKQKMLVSLPLL